MKKIPLTRGFISIIDDEDYERVSQYKWFTTGTDRYAYGARQTSIFENGRRVQQRMVRLHRFIMDAPESLEVDHIDGNTLNNQKSNLRLATRAQNSKNQKTQSRSKSGQKGVVWKQNRWRVEIMSDGNPIHIGQFKDKQEAIRAYLDAAVKYHGEFANIGGNK